MRPIALLCVALALPAAAAEPASSRFPQGAVAYAELDDFAGTWRELRRSALGQMLLQHPSYKAFSASSQGLRLQVLAGMLYGATGQDLDGLLDALASGPLALALYPGEPEQPRWLAALRADGPALERLLVIGELVTQSTRVELAAASGDAPALFGYADRLFGFTDGDLWVLGSDRALVEQARTEPRRPLSSDPRLRAARERLNGADAGVGFVDLEPFRARLQQLGKPPNIGAALLLGGLGERVRQASWASIGLGLRSDGDALRVELSGLLPADGRVSGAVRDAYGGALGPLPFDLGERALAELRLRRDVGELWSHRNDLIADAGIPGLVTFETTFGVITGGMNLVEEFLPALDGDVSLLAARAHPAHWGDGAAPAPRYPQAALLLRIREPAAMTPRLAVGFQTLIGVVNADRAQKGQKPYLMGLESHRGVQIHEARFLPPTAAEMEGLSALPVRFNFAPAHAVVGEHLVLATSPALVRELIDAHGRSSPVPERANARLALRGREAAQALAENREALVAQNMLTEGNNRVEAERAIDLVLDVARHVRDVELLHEQLDDAERVGVRVTFAAPGS